MYKTASAENLYASSTHLKIQKPNKPQKGKKWTNDDVTLMRKNVKTGLDAKINSISISLANDLLKRFGQNFTGNESTRRGQQAEEEIMPLLPSKLRVLKFKQDNADYPSPFHRCSEVYTTGAIARSANSSCVSSVDGLLVAQESASSQPKVWAVEVKTKTTASTVQAARITSGNHIFHVKSDWEETKFADLVK
jgi:hypothetical protein